MNKDSEEFKQGSNIIDLSTHKNNIRMPAPAAGGPPTVDKKKIKCVHWPNCRVTDDVCAYFHPKEECNKFPNCSFGDKCLYIHPDVSSLSLSYPLQVACKFGYHCTRQGCAYKHPKNKAPAMGGYNSGMQQVLSMLLMGQGGFSQPKPHFKKPAANKMYVAG